MLKFYHHPLSPISRRVWLALLEKKISFQPIIVDLKGEQYEPEFLELNPFHHVPIIVDDDFTLIESLAILDYLELKYPDYNLSSNYSVQEIAKTKMIQMITVNELVPKFLCFINDEVKPVPTKTITEVNTAFEFLNQQLGNNIYFGGNYLNLADLVVGATVPIFYELGVSLQPYPNLDNWYKAIMSREAWQKTQPSSQDFQKWKRWIQLMIKFRSTKIKRV